MESSLYAASSNDSGGGIPWNTYSDSVFYQKNTLPRAIVAITCVFSMIGSLLIILSYCISKKLRSQTRLILVHLSLMDFGVALANFIGIAVNFNQYYIKALHNYEPVSDAVQVSCVSDAFLACFCTNSSVLWTLSVAVYLHFRIVTHSQSSERFYKILLFLLYIINYGLPLLITLWMVFTHRLGFSPYDATGWCTIIVYKPGLMLKDGHSIDKLAAFFGSDMLIMITVILIPFLYWSISSHARQQLASVVTENKSNLKNKLQSIDLKFGAIPMFFIFLRIWSLILGIIYDYVGVEDSSVPHAISTILLYLSGIGDSGQGAANGVVFVAFTKKARQTLGTLCCLKCCKKFLQINDDLIEENDDQDDSTIRSLTDEENTLIQTNSSSHQKYQSTNGQTLYIIQSH